MNPLNNKNPRQKGWMRTHQQRYNKVLRCLLRPDTTLTFYPDLGLARQDFVTANYNEVKSLWGKRKIGHQEMCLHFLSCTTSCHAFYGMGCLAYF
ncbi:hypothetical protein MTR_3g466210 [Medicago truncatula]|uniref:Uncharacterized protein n=1 Tax=Medicago truncatula TaxID=3880 RepID=A0A072V8D3_MEDTR|nr:hypothetical protein MTR_3g466210 [Medicago truncatula]